MKFEKIRDALRRFLALDLCEEWYRDDDPDDSYEAEVL